VTGELEAVVASPATVDPFAIVAAMLALVVDPKACAERLQQLRAVREAAKQAQAALAQARADHDAVLGRERADLAELRKAADKRALDLVAREGRLTVREEALAVAQAEIDRRTQRFEQHGTLTREFVPDHADGRGDAHHRTAEDGGFEPDLPPMPAGVTLTRAPVMRGRPRRGAAL
jgi:hypothetical protein